MSVPRALPARGHAAPSVSSVPWFLGASLGSSPVARTCSKSLARQTSKRPLSSFPQVLIRCDNGSTYLNPPDEHRSVQVNQGQVSNSATLVTGHAHQFTHQAAAHGTGVKHNFLLLRHDPSSTPIVFSNPPVVVLQSGSCGGTVVGRTRPQQTPIVCADQATISAKRAGTQASRSAALGCAMGGQKLKPFGLAHEHVSPNYYC